MPGAQGATVRVNSSAERTKEVSPGMRKAVNEGETKTIFSFKRREVFFRFDLRLSRFKLVPK